MCNVCCAIRSCRRLCHALTSDTYCCDCILHAGDFNLVLLDQLLKEEQLRFVGCCNELNAGYAGAPNADTTKPFAASAMYAGSAASC